MTFTNDIHAMVSPENERVSLGKGLKARGNVEDWLGKVEEGMFSNLRKLTKHAINEYETYAREKWLTMHASQVVLTVSQLIWCRDITMVLEDDVDEDQRIEGMAEYERKSYSVRTVFV